MAGGGAQGTITVTVRELLDLIRGGNGPGSGPMYPQQASPPLAVIDPTLNVKEAMGTLKENLETNSALRADHAKEIRDLNSEWQGKLDAERLQTRTARDVAEAGRIDSRITDVVRSADLSTERLTNAATILANTVATTADTAQKALVAAADVQREMVGQVRDTVTALQSVVTTFIATGGGERSARSEVAVEARTRTQASQWTTGTIIGLAFGCAGLAFTAASLLIGALALLGRAAHLY